MRNEKSSTLGTSVKNRSLCSCIPKWLLVISWS